MNKELLEREGQAHILRFWDRLSVSERDSLEAQISKLDFASINRMRGMLLNRSNGATSAVEPEPAPVEHLCCPEEKAKARAKGEEALRKGQVAVVLVAGGQGSRLGFEGPKGAYPIGPITDKPLFYFHARKILALSKRFGASIPFYVMTSEANDAATRECFAQHDFFGLPREDVFFFSQGMWPALDPDGKIILDAPGHIFMSPDGHGGILSALESSGATADMARRGITTVFYFQVDNPMVAIADPEFIGLHLIKGADISIKVCAKRDPQEGLGMVVTRNGRFEMVEYTEFTDEQKNRRDADGELYFKFGSVAIHVFDFDFLRKEANAALPLHIAHKKIAMCADDGSIIKPEKPNGFKFEKFVFDVIPDAKNVLNLAFDRADEFSPVKNAEGGDSPFSCRHDLQAKWIRWFKECGIEIPLDAEGLPVNKIEIDPATADNAEALKDYLANNSVKTDSIINI